MAISGTEQVSNATQHKPIEEKLRESERKLSWAMELAHAATWEWEIEANNVVWSDNAYHIFDLEIGMPITYEIVRERVHPDDREYHDQQTASWLENRGGSPFEYRIGHSDGSIHHILAVGEVICDASGKPERLLGLVQDVTEFKQVEELHRTAERKKAEVVATRFHHVLEDSLNEIYIFDAETLKFIDVNRGARKNLGYSIEELRALTPVDLKPEYTPESFAAAIEPLRKGTLEIFKFTTMHRRRDGSLYPVEVNLQLIGHDEPVFVAFIYDLTERKKAEAEKDRLQRELRQSQKMQAVGVLAGGIAHEFNNLLTPIIGFSEMLMMGKLEDDPDFADLRAIQNAGNRAASLIQQLLAYGRMSLSQNRAVQLETIVEDTIRLIENTIPTNISVKKEFEEGLPAILGMPNEINQVILNLCINASHAMPAGGEITIRLKNAGARKFTNIGGQSCEGDFLKLSVQDTGLGINEDTMIRIFDPFFTTKEVGQGSGLGLSVVQGIVEQHEGHIEVDSTIGEGTTFDIYLPITQERAYATDVKIEQSTEGKGRILLVDDELMIIDLARSMLEELGYEVADYIDCEEALHSFAEHSKKFDLVITDYGMPKMNGKELAEQLKDIRPDIPIILITGYGDLVAKEEISSWGLDGLLTKPFKLQELSEVARNVMNKAPTEK